MSGFERARKPSRLCRVCLLAVSAAAVEKAGGIVPSHRVTLPDGGQGPTCRGSYAAPREPGQGRRHHVIT